MVLTDTKIQYHYGKMENFVSPNQIQIQIGLVLMVRPDTRDNTSQPCDSRKKIVHILIEGVPGYSNIISHLRTIQSYKRLLLLITIYVLLLKAFALLMR